jgi:hypothetical protein
VAAIGQLFHSYPQADLSQWASVGRFNAALFDVSLGFNPSIALTTPNFNTLQGQLLSANGYSQPGLPLNGSFVPAITEIEASSWVFTWTTSHAYKVGDLVSSALAPGYLFRCVVAGTSAGTAPTATVIDTLDLTSGWTSGAVTGPLFVNAGTSLTKFTSLPISWTAGSGSIGPVGYMVIYDTITTLNALLVEFGNEETALPPSQLTATPDTNYGWHYQLPF